MTDLDDTQPHATPVTPNVPSSPAASNQGGSADPAGGPDPAPGASPPTSSPPLVAAPPPATPSTWREPPWAPPREQARDRGPSPVAIVVGAIILVIGVYFFIDRTLGVDLPEIRWGSLWPILLVIVGGLIVVRALDRNR